LEDTELQTPMNTHHHSITTPTRRASAAVGGMARKEKVKNLLVF